MSRFGCLFIGLNGATGNTTAVGLLAAKSGRYGLDGAVSSRRCFDELHLLGAEELVLGGWDLVHDDVLELARGYRILPAGAIEAAAQAPELAGAMTGICGEHDPVPAPQNVRRVSARRDRLQEMLHAVRQDVARFKEQHSLAAVCVVHCGSPLAPSVPDDRLATVDGFLDLVRSDERSAVTSSMLYAWASIEEGCAFVDFTPNRTLEVPSILALAEQKRVPLAGCDGSTGETMLKMALAELLVSRGLRVRGWYGTNILGNNDGRILTDGRYAVDKLDDKLNCLAPILGYDDFAHVVNIDFYEPRGDDKEAWDVVDFEGWFGRAMQLRFDWCGRDSVLAAPLLVDLIRFMEFELRRGTAGVVVPLGIYFKHPIGASGTGYFALLRAFEEHYLGSEGVGTLSRGECTSD